eukprot:EG_transcript_25004
MAWHVPYRPPLPLSKPVSPPLGLAHHHEARHDFAATWRPKQPFSDQDNATMRRLKVVLRQLGTAFAALSASEVIGIALAGPEKLTENLIPTLLHLKNVAMFGFIAVCLFQASNAFSRLAKDKDSDVRYLMRGLRSLTRGLSRLVLPILLAAGSHLLGSVQHFAEVSPLLDPDL